jgi:hypothetical protein
VRSAGPPDVVADTLWVYANLERSRARPADCRSTGAWGLLRWARNNPSSLFEKMLTRALARQEEGPTEEEQKRLDDEFEEEKAIARLNALIEGAVSTSR